MILGYTLSGVQYNYNKEEMKNMLILETPKTKNKPAQSQQKKRQTQV